MRTRTVARAQNGTLETSSGRLRNQSSTPSINQRSKTEWKNEITIVSRQYANENPEKGGVFPILIRKNAFFFCILHCLHYSIYIGVRIYVPVCYARIRDEGHFVVETMSVEQEAISINQKTGWNKKWFRHVFWIDMVEWIKMGPKENWNKSVCTQIQNDDIERRTAFT